MNCFGKNVSQFWTPFDRNYFLLSVEQRTFTTVHGGVTFAMYHWFRTSIPERFRVIPGVVKWNNAVIHYISRRNQIVALSIQSLLSPPFRN